MIKIVHNKLLGGFYIVRGPHHSPLSGRFATREQARQALELRLQALNARVAKPMLTLA